MYDASSLRNPLTRAIHRMKYGGNRSLAGALGTLLAEEAPLPPQSYAMVVPVPLHPRQLRRRGFNQALLLARPLARCLKVPVRTEVLERQCDTRPQVGLSRGQRLTNVRGAFRATAPLAGAAILVIDDVCTTGATIDACARALRGAGARTVDVCALARTIRE